ncbi:MAG: bifunctional diaminohydroxyphosphoribosylaminopyrimidine deaminase/5-amino-6-(5-phosphoribosylamino)uracil reductase RibD, partial [Myxococcales bacterium]|nr:bifunctional diaminohydroxyphosphoribosylaminopyrimidine deaminase/5-amino-6-(5-phosphoribosylamino)uracil reductase RibD [Myxococcales bacterium]
MRRALALAARGRGLTSPNPMVGCVIVRGGRVVGEGHHRRVGGPHAEIHALGAAGDAARGATVYVTLEPCAHHGRTPPCVDAVLAARPARVVVAMEDPNPLVAGRGLRRLRAAGIPVNVGVLAAEAGALNEAFIKHVTTGLPYVVLKAALTLDGKVATAAGHSQWITGERARAHAHRWRGWSDAIVVGVGTILADDPALT